MLVFMPDLGGAEVAIVALEFVGLISKPLALCQVDTPQLVIDREDALLTGQVKRIGSTQTKRFWPSDADHLWHLPADGQDAIALN